MQTKQREEEEKIADHAQAFLRQKGHRRHNRGGQFNSKGRGFSQANRLNNQHFYSSQNNLAYQGNGKSNNTWKNFTGNRQGNYNKQNEEKMECQIYGRTNHTAIKCFYRYDYAHQGEEMPEKFAALSLQETDPSFYADYGASKHMTNDFGKLTSVHTYNGHDGIYVGNGNKLAISHTGNALLKHLMEI